MRPWREQPFIVVLVASTVFGSACARADGPGVSMAKLQSEIVFGVKEKAELPQLADTPNVTDAPVQAQFAKANVTISALEMPPAEDLSVSPQPLFVAKPRPSLRAVSTCPDAALNAFPEEPAPLNVPADRLPVEGSYRWKKSGTSRPIAGLENLGPQLVSGFEERVIRNLKVLQVDKEVVVAGNTVQEAGTTYEYQMVLPDLATGRLVGITYQVKTNGATAGEDFPIEEFGGEARTGDPERGVVLKKIEPLDGSKTGVFEPVNGLQLLPLRVRPGETFTSAAVDPTTGQTMQIEGTVKLPVRVDACGEILEGWQIESVLKTNNANPIKYTYVIAPQLGATFISQAFEVGEGATKSSLTFSIGQKLPGVATPPPEG